MDPEFLDTSVAICIHARDDHTQIKNYNDDTCHACTTNYGSIHVQNVAHRRSFSSWVEWVCEFLNWENLAI